jgi:tellurite resistance protein
LTEGGFSGFWGAFTFPVAAFAGALMMVGDDHGWRALVAAGGLVLGAATLAIPVIAVRVLKLWATGALAVKSNAAIA